MLLKVAYDYGQLYIDDAEREFSGDSGEYLDALDAATATGLTVGIASGLIDVLMPRQENFAAALEVTVVQSRPSVIETADHVVEFDLDCSGRVALEGSGGSGVTEVDVAPGRYRARVSGFDLAAAAARNYGDPGDPADHYRLELWPTDDPSAAAELKRWPGYADLM